MNNKEYIRYLSDMYYQGTPAVSDEVYDALVSQIPEDSLQIGSVKHTETPHAFKMYSLSKSKPSDIDTWPNMIVTPKLDGAAISLLYVNQELVLGLTRGDGKKGRVITDKVRLIDTIPHHIKREGVVQVTGEIVTFKEIPNARNYASGALSLESLEEFKTRKLVFIAYDFSPYLEEDHSWATSLNRIGAFRTVINYNCDAFPQDGSVARIDDCKTYIKKGYTAHHPRGAYAIKENKEGVVTTLLDVVWNVGRTGVVTPVAILEPIVLGEATVSRATLHNIGFIRQLQLQIGCKVEVIRSGEIIPAIVRKVNE